MPRHQPAGDASILQGYATEDKFARDNKVTKRTVAEYRKKPNGLPYVEWGGKIFIPVEAAREYLHARTKRPNPTRRGA